MSLLSRIDPDRFSKFASGVQSVVTTIGIVAAGAWAYVTFWELGSTQKSRAEIAEIDQRVAAVTFGAIVLSIDIKWDASGEIRDGKRPISIMAVFRNDGKQTLRFQNTTLQIVKLLDSGEPDTREKALRIEPRLIDESGKVSTMPRREFSVGMIRTIGFPVPLLFSGSYLIQIRTEFVGLSRVGKSLVESSDGWGAAIEQSIVTVPSGQATLVR
jgi:hypothetical protein